MDAPNHPATSEPMDIHIRPETEKDAPSIEAITIAAFRNVTYSDHTEQYIVGDLREAKQLSISLVAEDQATQSIVGHVAISPVKIADGTTDWYGLGPVSVLPQHQRQGIGSRLVEEALSRLREREAAGCVVLGNPRYYTRFGFKVEDSLRLPGVPPDHFMAISFRGSVPAGDVVYSKAFRGEK